MLLLLLEHSFVRVVVPPALCICNGRSEIRRTAAVVLGDDGASLEESGPSFSECLSHGIVLLGQGVSKGVQGTHCQRQHQVDLQLSQRAHLHYDSSNPDVS